MGFCWGYVMVFKRILVLAISFFSLCLHANYSDQLRPYFNESLSRNLPGTFFLDLFAADAWIEIKPTQSGPHYQPGYITGGTIYHDAVGTQLSDWKRNDFASFYNELFHAWWGNVFLRSATLAKERSQLLNDPNLKAKYRKANPSSPELAQEEAYSETVSFLIFQVYRGSITDLEKLYYQPNVTVAPVSHSDRPGYTMEAESIFPDEREFDWLFQKLFLRKAPTK